MSRAKTSAVQLPKLRTGGRAKLIALLVVVAIVWLVIKDPVGVAHAVTEIGHGIGVGVDAIVTFVRALG
jgi:hypothetical protein